ncbi:MAG: SNARE domain-containing protein [Sulfobacillus sp.]
MPPASKDVSVFVREPNSQGRTDLRNELGSQGAGTSTKISSNRLDLDKGLDDVLDRLSTIHEIALQINHSLDEQNGKLDRLCNATDRQVHQLGRAAGRMRELR